MRKIMIIAVLWAAVFATSMVTAASMSAIILTLANGDEVTLAVDARPVMTISDDRLVIKGEKVSMEYLLADLKDYRFGAPAGAESAATAIGKAAVSVDGNLITVTAADKSICDVKIYNLDGVEMMTRRSDNGICTVDISGLMQGVYILSVNGVSSKIVRQ